MNKIAQMFSRYIGSDGMMHIIVSSIITVVLKCIGLNPFIVVGIVVALGIAKEIYDKVTKKGYAEWKDIGCDLFGILIGIL